MSRDSLAVFTFRQVTQPKVSFPLPVYNKLSGQATRYSLLLRCILLDVRSTSRIQESRLLYYLVREIKTWLNINHITVHNKTYCIF